MSVSDQVAWPPRQEPVETAWSVEDLQPGDLVFATKAPGADSIQWVFEFSKHPWRHVASVIERDGELHVVEIDRNEFIHRPLAAFFAAFDRFGAARLGLDPRCIASASDWMESKVGVDHVYAWDDLMLAGVLALTAHGPRKGRGRRVRAALNAAVNAAKEGMTSGATESYTCSGFIQVAYEEVGGNCSIIHERWRRAESWPPRLDSLDDLLRDDLEPAEQQRLDDLYSDASLLELYELTHSVDRGLGDLPISDDQTSEWIRVLRHALAGFFAGPTPDRLETDGRWVTPTDLWSSPSVTARGPLTVPSD